LIKSTDLEVVGLVYKISSVHHHIQHNLEKYLLHLNNNNVHLVEGFLKVVHDDMIKHAWLSSYRTNIHKWYSTHMYSDFAHTYTKLY